MYIKYLSFILVVASFQVLAEEIEIPNTFTAGNKAIAAEVNENFSTLANESNSQNTRLNSLEAAAKPVYEDKMICSVWHTWIYYGSTEECVQLSAPSDTRNLIFSDVIDEGWTLISVGGGEHQTYLFGK